ncbi:MAG TPA: OmpW family outer membrane protein [Rhodoblastus sp.]|nr:OmpW family outer membrane protein [Rhodoblastus sp.]
MNFKAFLRGAASVAGLLVLGSAAVAADLPSRKVAPAEPVVIDTFQPFQIRLRATAIVPDGKTTVYDRFGGVLPLVFLSGGAGSPILGSGAKVSTTVIPELDVSYYFTKNIAIEAICCLSKHSVTGTGVLAGLNVGSTWVFPPTVLLQYHFTNFGAFQPYIGVGVNFTAYFGAKGGNQFSPFFTPVGLVGSNAVTNLSVGSSWGVAGQVGFDYMINQNWGVNVDLKRIMMQPTAYATVWNSAVSPVLGPIPVRAKVNIDPWVVSAGITYRFGGGAGAVVAKY